MHPIQCILLYHNQTFELISNNIYKHNPFIFSMKPDKQRDQDIPEMYASVPDGKPIVPENHEKMKKEMEKTKKELEKLKSFILKKYPDTQAISILPPQAIGRFIEEEEVPKETEKYIQIGRASCRERV